MSLPEFDAFTGYSFGLEVDGVVIRNITEVTGRKMEQDVIEIKENTADGRYSVKKLPGRRKAAECTLTRPLSRDNSFEQFIKDSQMAGAEDARKGGSIIVFDLEGEEVKRYQLNNIRPKSLEMQTLKEGDTVVLTEKLVLTYEAFEIE